MAGITAPVSGTIYLASLSGNEQVALASGAGNITTTTQSIANLAVIPSAPVTSVAAKTGAVTLNHALVAGAAAGNITVAGIKTTDTLNSVIVFVGAGTAVTDVTDLTSQFTISAANTINNASGTATTGNKLLVQWASD